MFLVSVFLLFYTVLITNLKISSFFPYCGLLKVCNCCLNAISCDSKSLCALFFRVVFCFCSFRMFASFIIDNMFGCWKYVKSNKRIKWYQEYIARLLGRALFCAFYLSRSLSAICRLDFMLVCWWKWARRSLNENKHIHSNSHLPDSNRIDLETAAMQFASIHIGWTIAE